MPRKKPTPKDKAKSRAGRIGGLVAASRVDVKARGAKGAAAFLARLEHEVDPEGVLPPEERTRRAVALRRAHMLRIRSRQS